MSSKFLVATYSDAETLLHGVRSATEENFRVYDVYAPYPIHGLDHAMGLRRSRLPWVTFLVGILALTFALTFQFYTTVLDWPLNVGGKPDNSTLAFVPICFELTVLLSGLATVAALLLRARLYPGKKELLFAEGVTDDTFALVLRRRETGFDLHRALRVLQESGADRIREREVDL
jgi:vacuolar-type H+-ATPase subunit I/STV1